MSLESPMQAPETTAPANPLQQQAGELLSNPNPDTRSGPQRALPKEFGKPDSFAIADQSKSGQVAGIQTKSDLPTNASEHPHPNTDATPVDQPGTVISDGPADPNAAVKSKDYIFAHLLPDVLSRSDKLPQGDPSSRQFDTTHEEMASVFGLNKNSSWQELEQGIRQSLKDQISAQYPSEKAQIDNYSDQELKDRFDAMAADLKGRDKAGQVMGFDPKKLGSLGSQTSEAERNKVANEIGPDAKYYIGTRSYDYSPPTDWGDLGSEAKGAYRYRASVLGQIGQTDLSQLGIDPGSEKSPLMSEQDQHTRELIAKKLNIPPGSPWTQISDQVNLAEDYNSAHTGFLNYVLHPFEDHAPKWPYVD